MKSPARSPVSPSTLAYDRLVFALGSELVRPPIPGLAEHGFDIDTYAAAAKLKRASRRFARSAGFARAASRALVVGGGLTGVEMATELATAAARDRRHRAGAGRSSPTARRGSARTWATAPAR